MLSLSDILAQPYRPQRVEKLICHTIETVADPTGHERKQRFMFLPADVGGQEALASLARAGVQPVTGVTKENGMLVKYVVPTGWYVEGRGCHYSELFDSSGHVRAILQLNHLFGRKMVKARMPLVGRFYLFVQFNQKDEGFHVQVRDRDHGDAVLFAGKPWDFSSPESYREGMERRRRDAEDWLDANYSNWRDPSGHR